MHGDSLGAELATRFGLTPAEGRVAAQLAQGKSVREIALELHVTHHTVRSQLKSVFQKTGTRRQGELIHRLLTKS
jgi:DNA-binding CsgD family transcriptional regulator